MFSEFPVAHFQIAPVSTEFYEYIHMCIFYVDKNLFSKIEILGNAHSFLIEIIKKPK